MFGAFANEELKQSQFGAGGGFLASQGPSSAKKIGTKQTLRALTLKQLKQGMESAVDDMTMVDGEEINNITLVGRVERQSQSETCILLELHDGTASLEVKLYVDAEDPVAVSKSQACQAGTYIKMYGALKPMDNRCPVVAYSVKPITDFNEITYHFLSCIYQHAHFTRASDLAPAGPTNGLFGGVEAGVAHAVKAEPVSSEFKSPLAATIYEVLNSTQREWTPDTLAENFGGRYAVHDIREALGSLTDDGKAYNTSGENFMHCAC